MRIGPEEVRRVAALAELAVDDADLATLTAQMDRIVAYVAQLDAAPDEGNLPPFVAGPAEVAWRDDTVRPDPLALPPAALAPAFRDGFFVVPRLSAMEDA